MSSRCSNRNVFIDYPEFAWLLFGRELPADYDTPSGYAHEHGSDVENFTLTAASSDETRGTVTVRSHTVTAFPAEGYCVGGYTLTPADAAVVKQNGNVFTVSRMTKDCTLTVQFDPRTPSTVHFSVPEGVTAPADAAGYTGDTFTFPQPSGTPSDTAHDYTFLGWAAAPQTDTDSRPDFSAAGAEQMFTQAEQTYYALYYYKVDDPDAVGDEYRRVMVAPDDWTGSYCIVSSDKGKIMTNTPGSKPTYLEAADIEIDSGSVRDPEWVYTLTAAGDGTYYVRDAAGLYLSCTGKKNVSLTETPDDTCRWTPTLNGLQSDNGMLQYNASSPRFTTYTSSQSAAHLYAPAAGSKTWYTTLGGSEPTPHEHTWGVWEIVEAATCFHDGLEARSCTGCDAVESRVIPANSDNCPSKAFTDRPDRGWYHESVDYVLETGLMNGMSKGQVRAGHHPQPRHGRHGPLSPLRRQGQRDERLPGRSGERVVRRGRGMGPAEGDRHGLRGRHIPPDGGDQPSGHGAHAAALCEDRQGNRHDPDGRPQPLAGCRSGRLVGC